RLELVVVGAIGAQVAPAVLAAPLDVGLAVHAEHVIAGHDAGAQHGVGRPAHGDAAEDDRGVEGTHVAVAPERRPDERDQCEERPREREHDGRAAERERLGQRHDTASAAGGSGSFATSGSSMTKVVPSPGDDPTSMRPPWRSTMPYEIERPRPVPCPTGFVVKNGSKTRACTSGDMPGPSSWHSRR